MKHIQATRGLVVAGLIAGLFQTACGHSSKKGGADGSSTDGSGTVAAGGGGASNAPKGAGVTVSLLPAGSKVGASLSLLDQAMHVGETSLGELKSLKYFITSITICQDVTLSGSGYSNQSGCLDLYSNQDATQDLYQKMDQKEAAKSAYDKDFKDLMQGLTVNGQITKDKAGTYKYALVNWMKPIKVTAQTTLDDAAGTVLYTHAGTYQASTDQNSFTTNETLVPRMTTGPADEAITMLGNGGSVFAFGQPFTISADDVANGTQYAMDMVFNPEGMVKGADFRTALSSIFAVDASGNLTGPSMQVPYLSLIPLVHKSADAVVKETYLVHFTAGLTGTAETAGATPVASTDPFDVRIELYYLKAASAVTPGATITSDLSESIYGAHAELLYVNTATAKTLDPPSGVPNIYSFSQDPATKAFSFYSWQGAAGGSPVTGLKRLTNVGDTGTAQLHCTDGNGAGVVMSQGGCYDSGSSKYYGIGFNVSYELAGRETVSALSQSIISSVADTATATATATATSTSTSN